MTTSAPPTPRPLDECTALQRDILILTAQHGAQSGKELMEQLNGTYQLPDNEVSESRFYAHLDKLQQAGLMTAHERDGRTKEYQLTETGVRRLIDYAAWVSNCTGEL